MPDPAPRVGKTFTGHIHRIDDDGNGIIETYGGHINIGPVLPDTEGEWVEALKLPGGYARCNRNKLVPDDYKKKINEQFPHDLPLGPDGGHVGGILGKRDQGLDQQEEKYRPIPYNDWVESSSDSLSVGDVHTVKIGRINNKGNGIAYINGHEIEIDSVNKRAGSETTVRITGQQSAVSIIGNTRTVEIDRVSTSGNGIIYVDGQEITIGPIKEEAVGSEVDVEITGEKSVKLLDDSVIIIGDRRTVEIDRISNSGSGIIDIQGREIDIGPIKEEAVGSEVDVEITGKESVKLLDNSVRPTHTVEVDRISNSGNGVVYVDGREISIGPIKKEAVGSELDIAINGYQSGIPVDKAVNTKDSEDTDNSRGADSVQEHSEKEQESINDSPGEGTETNSEKEQRTLSDLRDQAIADAEENVSINEKSSSSSSEYTRSSKVKSYVKARADGQCEGCGADAPFVSKTEEPYLHAHHVYELSEGGPDTPDTVIALCPNCHYRIHHGRDGDEYNQELIEKLQKIEGTPG